MKPARLQLSRKRGFDLQAASQGLNRLSAQVVSRPGRWGNPFAIADVAAREGLDVVAARARAVAMYGEWLEGGLDEALSPGDAPSHATIVAELAGKNLACWCSLDGPCHADVLLRIANPDQLAT
ncbi:MAG TPA: DUF4326 domain-containing protein [Devosiaceae bacterium]|jgi:hypothetical protein